METSAQPALLRSLIQRQSTSSLFKRGLIEQVRHYVDLATHFAERQIRTAGKRKSTLVFAVNVAHVRALTKTFQLAGIDARYLYSGTPSVERVAVIDAFKAGEFPVLLNCGKAAQSTSIQASLHVFLAIAQLS